MGAEDDRAEGEPSCPISQVFEKLEIKLLGGRVDLLRLPSQHMQVPRLGVESEL